MFTGDDAIFSKDFVSKSSSEISHLQEEILKLQKQIDQRTAHQQSSNISEYHKRTMCVGGLQEFDNRDSAKTWLNYMFMDYGINLPYKMESRDDIIGMLFCSFKTEAERDAAVSAMRMEPMSYMGQSIWAAPSMPLQSRISQSFLFGLKRLLVSWGFRKQSIKVDPDDMSMHVENKIVCTASCTNNKLVLNWEDRWKNWKELHTDVEFVRLLEICRSKLLRGTASKGKGKASD